MPVRGLVRKPSPKVGNDNLAQSEGSRGRNKERPESRIKIHRSDDVGEIGR